MNEPGIEAITAFANHHGLTGLTLAELARMAALAETVAEGGGRPAASHK